jgi:glutamate synthase domain-containing protein 2
MGISTVASYRGGQLFEAVGLSLKWWINASWCTKPYQRCNFVDLENDQKNWLIQHGKHVNQLIKVVC